MKINSSNITPCPALPKFECRFPDYILLFLTAKFLNNEGKWRELNGERQFYNYSSKF